MDILILNDDDKNILFNLLKKANKNIGDEL